MKNISKEIIAYNRARRAFQNSKLRASTPFRIAERRMINVLLEFARGPVYHSQTDTLLILYKNPGDPDARYELLVYSGLRDPVGRHLTAKTKKKLAAKEEEG